ncbi:hypothetical protein FRC07_008191, partial [Ceratobasidium sp. 392]
MRLLESEWKVISGVVVFSSADNSTLLAQAFGKNKKNKNNKLKQRVLREPSGASASRTHFMAAKHQAKEQQQFMQQQVEMATRLL